MRTRARGARRVDIIVLSRVENSALLQSEFSSHFFISLISFFSLFLFVLAFSWNLNPSPDFSPPPPLPHPFFHLFVSSFGYETPAVHSGACVAVNGWVLRAQGLGSS